MKPIKFITTALVIAFAFSAPLYVRAEEKKTEGKTKTAEKTEAGKPTSYYGTVSAADKKAQTFTITYKKGDKVFSVTADTKITNKGKAATFDDITAGAYVTGSYTKDGDKNVAKLVKLGEEKPKDAGDKGGTKADTGAKKAESK